MYTCMYIYIVAGDCDGLVASCEEHQLFLEEVRSKSADMENVDGTGARFLGSAKVGVVQRQMISHTLPLFLLPWASCY